MGAVTENLSLRLQRDLACPLRLNLIPILPHFYRHTGADNLSPISFNRLRRPLSTNSNSSATEPGTFHNRPLLYFSVSRLFILSSPPPLSPPFTCAPPLAPACPATPHIPFPLKVHLLRVLCAATLRLLLLTAANHSRSFLAAPPHFILPFKAKPGSFCAWLALLPTAFRW